MDMNVVYGGFAAIRCFLASLEGCEFPGCKTIQNCTAAIASTWPGDYHIIVQKKI